MNLGLPKSEVELTCAGCKANFLKDKKEHTRQLKNRPHHKFYCCQKCSDKNIGRLSHRDELSDFRRILQNSKRNQKRSTGKSLDNNLSLEFLKELWEKQNGICPYTGIKMEFNLNGNRRPRAASLDRIDSSEGYTQNNVEFVCEFINLGKNGFNKSDVQKFLQEINIKQKFGDNLSFDPI